MITQIKDFYALLKEFGFSHGSLKEAVPSFVKNLGLFLSFGVSLVFFLGFVYFEAAISALPAPLRMGLHESGASPVSYFNHGFTVLAAIATDYSAKDYLFGLLVALALYWMTLRFTSLILTLTNPLTPLKIYGTMPEEERSALAGGVFSLVRETPDEIRGPAIKIFKAVIRSHAFLRVLDLWIMAVLVIYVFVMAAVVLVDALGLTSVVGAKCLTFFGTLFNSLDAPTHCRNLGFINPDLYWQPAFALILVVASWFSLRHARTFRALRMVTTIVASVSLLLLSVRLGERNGGNELTLWRVQIADEETKGAAPSESRQWLLVKANAEHLLLFDEGSNALYDYRGAPKHLIFLEQVAFGMVGKGKTANPQ